MANHCGRLVFGVSSMIDSILGATLQATYYHKEKKCIVKHVGTKRLSIELICGMDVLSNEAVNFISIAISMSISIVLSLTSFLCV